MIDYLNNLNPSQQAAVTYCEGPSLVIAGAGSGKTRVLTYKIAYLLEHGYEPWKILALTFTNKAAAEMKQRIAKQVGNDIAKHLWMGTFHSIFARILRFECTAIGFTSNFTIYDAADSRSLVKSIIKELNLDDKIYKPNMILGLISRAKNMLILPETYANDKNVRHMLEEQRVTEIPQIYINYWNRCKQAGAMDFDDLLLNTYILFNSSEDILKKYQQKFKYILVDEYQDTNYAQHCIVKLLSGLNNHVCVVGDDAQSIYSFRGAKIDNILKFTQEFEGAKEFKLEQNYRSTQTIVDAANSLIEKNKLQIRKKVFSENDKGQPIELIKAYSDREEGEIVVSKIADMHRRLDYEYDDFAILYRTNAQSRIFEEALRKRNIPYKIYGGLSFYQRKEIKDVMAYFRMAVNPMDEEAFKRVLNYPSRGIGDTTLKKIITVAANHKVSLWDVISDPVTHECPINNSTAQKLGIFRSLIVSFIEATDTMDAASLGEMIMKDSGIVADVYKDNSPEDVSRQENLQELLNGLKDFTISRQEEDNAFVSLTDFLQDVSLLTDQDSDKNIDGAKVTLMTIHAAKGLEFANIFIVGMEEGLFPSPQSEYSSKALEEERRLFYVAITRARENCFLSYAMNRFLYGKMSFCTPSRFLKDIDPSYMKMDDDSEGIDMHKNFDKQPDMASQIYKMLQTPATPPKDKVPINKNTNSSNSNKNGCDLQIGQHIEHERFGIGEVINLEGEGDNRKATVKFKYSGEKNLLLRFARFKVINE